MTWAQKNHPNHGHRDIIFDDKIICSKLVSNEKLSPRMLHTIPTMSQDHLNHRYLAIDSSIDIAKTHVESMSISMSFIVFPHLPSIPINSHQFPIHSHPIHPKAQNCSSGLRSTCRWDAVAGSPAKTPGRSSAKTRPPDPPEDPPEAPEPASSVASWETTSWEEPGRRRWGDHFWNIHRKYIRGICMECACLCFLSFLLDHRNIYYYMLKYDVW